MSSTIPLKHVVIVGGGFAGVQAAQKLRDAPVRITIVDRENHHLFQPLLYQVASAGLSPGQIAVPIRSIFRRQENVWVVLGEVIDVDLPAKIVVLHTGQKITYDYLVVAAGAKTNYFGHEGWADHAHGLKDLRDAIRIRERVLLAFEAAERETDSEVRRRLLTFVVIGGGPTGVEMAGAISELGRQVLADDFRTIKPESIRVVLIEMADRVLTPFDPALSERAQVQLRELGVELRLGQTVTNVSELGVELGDQFIEASVVVWATGVQAVSLAAKLGTELMRGRVRVEHDCSVPNHPEVFAIGDMAYFVPPGTEAALPGLATVAMQQGRHVARQIRDELWYGKPRQTFRYWDKGIMATIGRSRAVLESGPIKMAGFFAWLGWLAVHIWYLIDFRNRLMVLLEWAWSYLAYGRGARIITARYFPIRPDWGRREDRPGPDPLRVVERRTSSPEIPIPHDP